MTKVKAQANWIRISPRKLSLVAKLVRKKNAVESVNMLKLMPQKGARILAKVILSAIANAKNNYKLTEKKLVIVQAFVTKGTSLKRWRARARGRVGKIEKRTSHLTVWVDTKEEA